METGQQMSRMNLGRHQLEVKQNGIVELGFNPIHINSDNIDLGIRTLFFHGTIKSVVCMYFKSKIVEFTRPSIIYNNFQSRSGSLLVHGQTEYSFHEIADLDLEK
jgi:hypothetical protein